MPSFTVRIDNEALKEAQELRDRDGAMFRKFVTLADQLEQRGTRIPQTKKLIGTKNGWRLDFGRYRALFSLNENVVIIWLIGMEKDTKKDYQRWIAHLVRSGKIA